MEADASKGPTKGLPLGPEQSPGMGGGAGGRELEGTTGEARKVLGSPVFQFGWTWVLVVELGFVPFARAIFPKKTPIAWVSLRFPQGSQVSGDQAKLGSGRFSYRDAFLSLEQLWVPWFQ